MTTPDERTRAVVEARRFLREIQRDQSLPELLRYRAETLLRHYPENGSLSLTATALPGWWSEPPDGPG